MIFLNNLAGKDNINEIVSNELNLAGLTPTNYLGELLYDRDRSEVKTTVYCQQYSWLFTRAWSYWVAKGNALPPAVAQDLWDKWGDVVRTEGHCGCPSPLNYNHGLGVSMYHIDSVDGLKALADCLKSVYIEKYEDTHEAGWKRKTKV